ncbi:hypothetical protein BOX15_Mlig030646g1 [Macrostomum lignano]|uniref:AAA+ ATPase domain-containing protein n=1 Tax=Macrostomum lignano TaxID=282301 RepID=A0A267GRF8_9PLAT|nr:hypothetical protein BOX15_Mlig030646g1 [Macrostomum lignano]
MKVIYSLTFLCFSNSIIASFLIFLTLGQLYSSLDDEEICDSMWISFNHTGFKVALDTKVYGQPLVGLANAVWHHWNDKQSAKALVLSLHGPTGTGKNYVAKILANHLYTRGTKSNFYRLFHAAVHFPHKSRLETYMSELQEWVRGNVSRCSKSMFVFDEFDKIPHGLALLDALKPFLDHNDHIGGVDYRRAIFIFLRNDGSDLIMSHMVEQKRLGRKRYDIYTDFDNLLSKHLESEAKRSQQPGALLYHSLVSQFIPLLPLEKDHVAGCIDDYLLDNQPDYLIPTCFIDRVLADIDFQPKVERYFASSGCKRVIEKTQFILERERIDLKRKREARKKEKLYL